MMFIIIKRKTAVLVVSGSHISEYLGKGVNVVVRFSHYW